MHFRVHQKSKNHWDMADLLQELEGITWRGSDIRCPFHNDSSPSASYFPEDNHLWCFRCKEIFSPADLLKKHGWSEKEIKEEIPEDVDPKKSSRSIEERDYKFFELFEEVWYDNKKRALNGLISYLEERNENKK